MIKLLTTYMLSSVIVATVLLTGCDQINSKVDNSDGVAINPTQNQENSVDTDNQVEDIIIDDTQNQAKEENIVTENTNTQQTSQYITQDQAKSIAFEHAGVSESQVSFVKVELDYEKGVAEYEVDFYVGTTEYDYEINATTGTVISYGKDMNNQSSNQGTNQSYITEESAKTTALNHAGITSSEASSMKVEFDFDNGVAQYEVEFKVGRTEYEYEINAVTGDIISFEKDND